MTSAWPAPQRSPLATGKDRVDSIWLLIFQYKQQQQQKDVTALEGAWKCTDRRGARGPSGLQTLQIRKPSSVGLASDKMAFISLNEDICMSQ